MTWEFARDAEMPKTARVLGLARRMLLAGKAEEKGCRLAF